MQNPYDLYKKSQTETLSKSKKKPKRKPRPMKKRQRKKKADKKPVEFSLAWIFGSLAGLSLSFYILFYTDHFIDTVSRIEVGMTSSMAAEGEKTSTEGKKESAKAAPLPVGRVSQLKSDADHLTMKNASVYEALKEKRRELEKKERRLAQLEEELQMQKVEIEKQLREMQEMRKNISSKLDRKVAADQESVTKLVGVYSKMKPKNAAVILSQIDEALAVKVLAKMKKQSAAEILNFVEPGKAQTLSEKFTGLKE